MRRKPDYLLIAAVLLGGVLGWSWLQLTAAPPGPLVLHDSNIDAGEFAPGEQKTVAVCFENVANTPVTVVGAQTDCSCAVEGGLPLTVAPGQTGCVKVELAAYGDESRFQREVSLILGGADLARVTVNIHGTVTEAKTP